MKYLRNLTAVLLLAGGVMGTAAAAMRTMPPGEHATGHDAGHETSLRAELPEPVSGGLIAILVANACVVATGIRIASNRVQHERERQATPAARGPHESVLDLA